VPSELGTSLNAWGLEKNARNFCGAERPSFQLSLKRGGSHRHMCPLAPASRGLIFQRAIGKGVRGEPPAHRNAGRCALTASRKNGSPAPAAFSLVR